MAILRFCLLFVLLLTACSREYTPEKQATGEQIYQAACHECHKPANNGSIFILKAENANKAYITVKVKLGSLLMPSFPNMKSDDLNKIGDFALEHSVITRE